MSDRLAISSAFSVFMMACYVLLGGDAVQVQQATVLMPHLSAPAGLSQVSTLLPR
jgi:hypothetical protein